MNPGMVAWLYKMGFLALAIFAIYKEDLIPGLIFLAMSNIWTAVIWLHVNR